MKEKPVVMLPEWAAPAAVSALVTTRIGGFSQPPFDSLNLGDHVGDRPGDVRRNRDLVEDTFRLPRTPKWLRQVHSATVVDAARVAESVEADASLTREPGVVCAVMTADCLPVLFAAPGGDEVAAAHAGWRGLAAGVLEATIHAMWTPADQILAWLGPAIGPEAFEVGEEVRQAFIQMHPKTVSAFTPSMNGRWLADIYALATIRLKSAGVMRISGGGFCTFTDRERFFSYRREQTTGRMASLIWIGER